MNKKILLSFAYGIITLTSHQLSGMFSSSELRQIEPYIKSISHTDTTVTITFKDNVPCSKVEYTEYPCNGFQPTGVKFDSSNNGWKIKKEISTTTIPSTIQSVTWYKAAMLGNVNHRIQHNQSQKPQTTPNLITSGKKTTGIEDWDNYLEQNDELMKQYRALQKTRPSLKSAL